MFPSHDDAAMMRFPFLFPFLYYIIYTAARARLPSFHRTVVFSPQPFLSPTGNPRGLHCSLYITPLHISKEAIYSRVCASLNLHALRYRGYIYRDAQLFFFF